MTDGLPTITLPEIKTKHLDLIEKYGGKHAGKALAVIAAAQVATYPWVLVHHRYGLVSRRK